MTRSNPLPEPFAHVNAQATTDDAQLAAFEIDAASEVDAGKTWDEMNGDER